MNKDDMNPQLNLEQSAVDLLDNKAKLSLYKKSSESGIPINILEEVFMRGYASWDGNFSRNPIQVAFNRVNSFLAGGFASQLDEDLKQSCWKDYEAIGTKKKNGKTVPNCVPVKEAVVAPPVQVSQPAAPAPTQIARPAPQRAQLNQSGSQFRASSQVSPNQLTQRSVRSGTAQARTSMGGQGGYSSASQQLKPTSMSTRTPTSYSASRTVPTPDSRLSSSGGGSMKPTSVKTNTPTFSQGGRVKMADGLDKMTRGMSQKAVAQGERSVGQAVAGRLGAAAGRVAGSLAGPAGAAVGAAAPILADKMKQSYKSGHETLRPQQGSGGEAASSVFNRMRNAQKTQGRSVDQYEKEVLTPAPAAAPTRQVVDAPAPPTRPKYMTRGQAFQAANKEGGDNAQFTYNNKVYQANRAGKRYVAPSKQIPTSVREEQEDLDEKLNLKKAAQVAGVAASLAYDAHHLHKNPHDVGYAAPAAVSYLAPGAKVAGSMIPAALKVDRANAGEDEKARQKKYAATIKKAVHEESKLLNQRTPSAKEIANKFDTSVSKVNKSIEQGTKVEREHTKSSKLAKEIATDHLGERPDYYKKLAALEKSPVKEEEVPTTKRRLLDGTKARTDWLKSSTPGQATSVIKKTVKEALEGLE